MKDAARLSLTHVLRMWRDDVNGSFQRQIFLELSSRLLLAHARSVRLSYLSKKKEENKLNKK